MASSIRSSADDGAAAEQRRRMVDSQIAARGVRSSLVLDAMGAVHRERYVPRHLVEFAYEDSPLPIGEDQTISQPYIVAFMVDALELKGGERVLEIGTGSGYAAAVLAEIAGEVFTIERREALARLAQRRLAADGYHNVHVRCGDGTLGWPEEAPFDAIVVAAGGPRVPDSLREQLAVGGRLVIPVGDERGRQTLVRVTRLGSDRYRRERLADVRFVPLVGAEGWHGERLPVSAAPLARKDAGPETAIAASAEPFTAIAEADLDPLLHRIGDARIVLLGEATHGTSEFHRMRDRITRALIERKGFRLVAIEADWPDAARIDHHVRDLQVPAAEWEAFARFPTWMWRNREVHDFVEALRERNLARPPQQRVRVAGLDLYSLFTSIDAVLGYLDGVDADAARIARERYGCLTPWQRDPAAYGRAALSGAYRSCEGEVARMLDDLLARRLQRAREGDAAWFDAVQNARLVADAERYYRTMYYGSHEAWNLRDRHMLAVLASLLALDGSGGRAVVWAHNSHVGDAGATDMAARGQTNLGQLCRQRWGGQVYAVGFGSDRGTVAAASEWGGPMEVKALRPALPHSHENVCVAAGMPAFLLPLRRPRTGQLRKALAAARLQRAVGVIYRPETERASHYFHAVLPEQFDEWVWLEQTTALQPLHAAEVAGMPDTYPFGL